MGIFYPFMRKAGYGLPTKDAIVVWWGALRGAIGLALALVVYSEHLRYDFSIEYGGKGYREDSTSVFILDKEIASKLKQGTNLDLFEGVSLSHAAAEVQA